MVRARDASDQETRFSFLVQGFILITSLPTPIEQQNSRLMVPLVKWNRFVHRFSSPNQLYMRCILRRGKWSITPSDNINPICSRGQIAVVDLDDRRKWARTFSKLKSCDGHQAYTKSLTCKFDCLLDVSYEHEARFAPGAYFHVYHRNQGTRKSVYEHGAHVRDSGEYLL